MGSYEKWKVLLTNSFDQFVTTLGAYLPSLLGAVILIIIGFVVAWIFRWLIIRAGKSIDIFVQKIGIGTQYLQLRWPLSFIIASVVYWLIVLFFITAAAESLGLPGFADWLGKLIAYLPSLFIAILIIIFGYAIGSMVRVKVTAMAVAAGILHADGLGSISKTAILLLSLIIGLNQIGIDVTLIEHLTVIFAAATLAAFALAFGLGAGSIVTNIIAARYVRENYRIGQQVRIDNIEGEILEMTNSSIVLDTAAGRTLIPARLFEEKASVLLDQKLSDES